MMNHGVWGTLKFGKEFVENLNVKLLHKNFGQKISLHPIIKLNGQDLTELLQQIKPIHVMEKMFSKDLDKIKILMYKEFTQAYQTTLNWASVLNYIILTHGMLQILSILWLMV